jgi:hypothetical protein
LEIASQWAARRRKPTASPSFQVEPITDERRSWPSRCIPGRHDWLIPADGRSPYCIRCGEPMPPMRRLRDPEDDTIVGGRA